MKKILLSLLVGTMLLSCSNSSSKSEIENRVINSLNVSELGTVEYTVRKIIKVNDIQKWTYGDRIILFSVTAYLKAGINMADAKIEPKGKRITVTMPHATLFSLNMPVEEIKVEFESYGTFRSRFTANEQNMLLQQGEEDIKSQLANYGILEDAERNADEFLRAMLTQMGFKEINIKFV